MASEPLNRKAIDVLGISSGSSPILIADGSLCLEFPMHYNHFSSLYIHPPLGDNSSPIKGISISLTWTIGGRFGGLAAYPMQLKNGREKLEPGYKEVLNLHRRIGDNVYDIGYSPLVTDPNIAVPLMIRVFDDYPDGIEEAPIQWDQMRAFLAQHRAEIPSHIDVAATAARLVNAQNLSRQELEAMPLVSYPLQQRLMDILCRHSGSIELSPEVQFQSLRARNLNTNAFQLNLGADSSNGHIVITAVVVTDPATGDLTGFKAEDLMRYKYAVRYWLTIDGKRYLACYGNPDGNPDKATLFFVDDQSGYRPRDLSETERLNLQKANPARLPKNINPRASIETYAFGHDPYSTDPISAEQISAHPFVLA